MLVRLIWKSKSDWSANMIKEFTIRPMFHYNANLKSDLFENNKEPLTMTVIAAPACHCSVQKFTWMWMVLFQDKQNSCTLTIKRVAAETVQSGNFAIVKVYVQELVGAKCTCNPGTLWFLQHWSFSELTENSIDSNKEITARAIIDARASCGVDPVFALRSVLLVNSDAQL